jgi:hypothetical protein
MLIRTLATRHPDLAARLGLHVARHRNLPAARKASSLKWPVEVDAGNAVAG